MMSIQIALLVPMVSMLHSAQDPVAGHQFGSQLARVNSDGVEEPGINLLLNTQSRVGLMEYTVGYQLLTPICSTIIPLVLLETSLREPVGQSVVHHLPSKLNSGWI